AGLNLAVGNPDFSDEAYSIASTGGTVRQLTSTPAFPKPLRPAISPDGSVVVFPSGGNPAGTNPSGVAQIYQCNADGSGLAQVTHFTLSSQVTDARIAGDDSTIVFSSSSNILGTNSDSSLEIFAIQANGTNLRQLTNGSGSSNELEIADNGSAVVF